VVSLPQASPLLLYITDINIFSENKLIMATLYKVLSWIKEIHGAEAFLRS
jgi:hypothetical protein